MRFVQEMAFQPASLLELSARVIKLYGHPYEHHGIPHNLVEYLDEARSCLNPRCRGVYFDARVEHVKFVDFCGMYRSKLKVVNLAMNSDSFLFFSSVPLMQYLCSSGCIKRPIQNGAAGGRGDECNKMRRVLLG